MLCLSAICCDAGTLSVEGSRVGDALLERCSELCCARTVCWWEKEGR